MTANVRRKRILTEEHVRKYGVDEVFVSVFILIETG